VTILDQVSTLSDGMAGEKAQFTRMGFALLHDAWDAEAVRFLQSRSDDLGQRARQQLELVQRNKMSLAEWARHSSQELIVVPEAGDPTCLCRFEYILGADAEMAKFVEEKITPIIDGLLGESFIPFKDKENEKAPGGGAFRPHQDFAAYQSFGPRYNVTAMISIDQSTAENGCLEFAINARDVAGNNPHFVKSWIEERPLFDHYSGGEKHGDIRDEIAEQLIWQSVPTSSTDLVLFDSFVPHRSYANRSKTYRRAMFLTFSAKREGEWYSAYYQEKRANYGDPKFHVSTPTAHIGSASG
jgi:2-aminoethylphosphonate dioxygenase